MFYSKNVSFDEFLAENVYISTKKELKQLLTVDSIVKKLIIIILI